MDELPLVKKPAIQVAREFYKNWRGDTDAFEKELQTYVDNAFVFVRPDLFMMAKIVDLGGGQPGLFEPAWYIRMAVGSLSELFRTLPILTNKVCFTRHGSLRLRMYSLQRIRSYIAAKQKETNSDG